MPRSLDHKDTLKHKLRCWTDGVGQPRDYIRMPSFLIADSRSLRNRKTHRGGSHFTTTSCYANPPEGTVQMTSQANVIGWTKKYEGNTDHSGVILRRLGMACAVELLKTPDDGSDSQRCCLPWSGSS